MLMNRITKKIIVGASAIGMVAGAYFGGTMIGGGQVSADTATQNGAKDAAQIVQGKAEIITKLGSNPTSGVTPSYVILGRSDITENMRKTVQDKASSVDHDGVNLTTCAQAMGHYGSRAGEVLVADAKDTDVNNEQYASVPMIQRFNDQDSTTYFNFVNPKGSEPQNDWKLDSIECGPTTSNVTM
jgi:hypothetical protein